MDKLGLGYKTVKKIAPDIVYVSISGYGQEGEYAMRAGHDINYLALSGNMSYSGREAFGPALYGMQVADIAASQNSVIGVLAAHNQSQLTGKGAHVDVAILDSAIPFNAMSGVGEMCIRDRYLGMIPDDMVARVDKALAISVALEKIKATDV